MFRKDLTKKAAAMIMSAAVVFAFTGCSQGAAANSAAQGQAQGQAQAEGAAQAQDGSAQADALTDATAQGQAQTDATDMTQAQTDAAAQTQDGSAHEEAAPAPEGENAGGRLAQIRERGKLIIGTEGTYSPNSFHDESGALVGFDVETAALIAKYMGVEPEYVETEWASIFAALDAGQIDVVVNEVGYTDERAEKYDFSEPYAFSRRCILVKGDNEDIKSFEDLAGHTAANESSSLFGQMAEEYGANLDPVNAMAQSISEVLNGRADCTLNYETAFNDYMKEHPEADVKIVAYADPEPSSYVPVIKGNSDLVDAINDALDKARESGELAEISKKYYGGVDVTASSGN